MAGQAAVQLAPGARGPRGLVGLRASARDGIAMTSSRRESHRPHRVLPPAVVAAVVFVEKIDKDMGHFVSDGEVKCLAADRAEQVRGELDSSLLGDRQSSGCAQASAQLDGGGWAEVDAVDLTQALPPRRTTGVRPPPITWFLAMEVRLVAVHHGNLVR